MSAKEVRLRHAKRLAEFTRKNKNGTTKASDVDDCSNFSPPKRSSSSMSNTDVSIYSMMLEQCRSLAVALRTAAPRIATVCSLWCDVRRADEVALLNAAIAEIEMCLGLSFGGASCCAYIDTIPSC